MPRLHWPAARTLDPERRAASAALPGALCGNRSSRIAFASRISEVNCKTCESHIGSQVRSYDGRIACAAECAHHDESARPRAVASFARGGIWFHLSLCGNCAAKAIEPCVAPILADLAKNAPGRNWAAVLKPALRAVDRTGAALQLLGDAYLRPGYDGVNQTECHPGEAGSAGVDLEFERAFVQVALCFECVDRFVVATSELVSAALRTLNPSDLEQIQWGWGYSLSPALEPLLLEAARLHQLPPPPRAFEPYFSRLFPYRTDSGEIIMVHH